MSRNVLIGNSLSQCVNSIMDGEKRIDEVLCVIAATKAASCEAMFDVYWQTDWQLIYARRKDELRALVETIWGRLVQPREYGIRIDNTTKPTWLELTLDPATTGAAKQTAVPPIVTSLDSRELLIGLDVVEAVIGYETCNVSLNDIACIVADTTCSCGELFETCWQEAWSKRLFSWVSRDRLLAEFKAYIWPRVVQPRLSGFEFSLEGQPSTWIKANTMQAL